MEPWTRPVVTRWMQPTEIGTIGIGPGLYISGAKGRGKIVRIKAITQVGCHEVVLLGSFLHRKRKKTEE